MQSLKPEQLQLQLCAILLLSCAHLFDHVQHIGFQVFIAVCAHSQVEFVVASVTLEGLGHTQDWVWRGLLNKVQTAGFRFCGSGLHPHMQAPPGGAKAPVLQPASAKCRCRHPLQAVAAAASHVRPQLQPHGAVPRLKARAQTALCSCPRNSGVLLTPMHRSNAHMHTAAHNRVRVGSKGQCQ